MQGKILGIPLAIIVLSFSIAALVDVPVYLIHLNQVQEVSKISKTVDDIRKEQIKPTATPTMTPTPTEIPSPTPKGRLVIPTITVTKAASQSGLVK